MSAATEFRISKRGQMSVPAQVRLDDTDLATT